MTTAPPTILRHRLSFSRRVYYLWIEARMVIRGLLSYRHPVLAHIIPMRRCNLACTYCNEFDDDSNPVPLAEMRRRLDRLADFGTSIITISGGEPLLHPQLDDIIGHIRRRGMLAGLITNGYLLTPERIKRLNSAGLQYLQISIDNIMPDDVSKKSMKVLDKKLQMLAAHAAFKININSVLGGGIKNPEDALVIGRRAVELGFSSSLGVIHDGGGQVKALDEVAARIFHEMKKIGKKGFARLNRFQDNLSLGQPNRWRCRAGSRYLYICEDGLVHYCSQQRGYPAIPLADYTRDDLEREYFTRKDCAPYCTVSCVHQTSLLDGWRHPQQVPEDLPRYPAKSELVQIG